MFGIGFRVHSLQCVPPSVFQGVCCVELVDLWAKCERAHDPRHHRVNGEKRPAATTDVQIQISYPCTERHSNTCANIWLVHSQHLGGTEAMQNDLPSVGVTFRNEHDRRDGL